MQSNLSLFRRPLAVFAVALAALSGPAHALIELNDTPVNNGNADYRPGKLLPTALQLAAVKSLGAEANWNKFGTINSMVKHGGYLATGLTGTPEQQARAFVKANAALFKLAPSSVDSLELINEGITPNNPGRAVLLRQKFGDLTPTHDGLITVGVVDGKVYYVSSSSAGDQPPAGAATLTPLAAWMIAAADVKRAVTLDKVINQFDMTGRLGWHVMNVKGFNQPQRARLSALPMPNGGVRQVFETIVLNSNGGDVIGMVHFIDAQTGQVLRRENRVNWQSAPTASTFQGAFPDAASCGPRYDVTVPAAQSQIVVVGAAAQPANDIFLNLYFNGALVASNDLLASPETLMYAPTGGLPAGVYSAEVCPFGGTALPPFNYVGTFTYTDAGGASAAVTLPTWSTFGAYPLPDFSGIDNRIKMCWGKGAGCDLDTSNIASRAPWDVLISATQASTMTTIGNNAITAEAWGSPLTPAEMYRPVSPTRSYIFPFENKWNASKCDPTNLVPQGNDIDAAVTDLFVKHNRMHDFSYFLGFTERNYNLQQNNFGNTDVSRENDPEIGNVQAGALSGSPGSPTFYAAPGRDNANQIALMDGVPGITNQYLFQSLGGALYAPCADGDLDQGIVGHEYTHAISNRMIGGPDSSIGGEQGGSMGEAWSDQVAGEYLITSGFSPIQGESATAIGLYATGNLKVAIRDYALDNNPLNYSNMGFDTPGPEVHSDGEIWNAVNWDIRTALQAKYNSTFPASDKVRQKDCAEGKYAADACPGNRRWVQLMFDSFLLMPAAPSMLDARDAMLAADVARFGGANQKELWDAFAKRGMGKDAYTNGGDDVTPVGQFESPLSAPATVTFKVLAGDESNAAISTAKIYIGQYEARSRPVADTDPATVVDMTDDNTRRATLNLADTAKLVPGTYDLVIGAPGYGLHRFRQTFAAGSSTATFTLPTNYASLTKGAVVLTSATVQANIDGKDTLIDDTEGTGVRIGDAGLVEGAYAIVQLAGGAKSVSSLHLSTAAGPTNPGRFTGIRKFEVRTCNGTCANAASDFGNIVYTSPDDAFPGVLIRPVQPDLIFRSFDFPAVMATHVMVRVLTTQCTGQPLYHGDQDSDPLVNADCPTFVPPINSVISTNIVFEPGIPALPTAPGSVARATDIQVFGNKAASSGGTVMPGPGTAPSDPVGSVGGGNTSGSVTETGGRFGGALGLGLLLPLLFGLGRRRLKVARGF